MKVPSICNFQMRSYSKLFTSVKRGGGCQEEELQRSAVGMSKAAPECPASHWLLQTTGTIFAGCYVHGNHCQFTPLTRLNLVLVDKNEYCSNKTC